MPDLALIGAFADRGRLRPDRVRAYNLLHTRGSLWCSSRGAHASPRRAHRRPRWARAVPRGTRMAPPHRCRPRRRLRHPAPRRSHPPRRPPHGPPRERARAATSISPPTCSKKKDSTPSASGASPARPASSRPASTNAHFTGLADIQNALISRGFAAFAADVPAAAADAPADTDVATDAAFPAEAATTTDTAASDPVSSDRRALVAAFANAYGAEPSPPRSCTGS